MKSLATVDNNDNKAVIDVDWDIFFFIVAVLDATKGANVVYSRERRIVDKYLAKI